MKELIMSLMAGLIVGLLFKFMKLPIPAPPVLSGILGILGVWLGSKIATLLIEKFTA